MSHAEDQWNYVQPKASTKMSLNQESSWRQVGSSTSIPRGYVVVPVDEAGVVVILVNEAGVVVIPVDETGVVVIPVDETGVVVIPVDETGVVVIPVDEAGVVVIPVDVAGVVVILVDEAGVVVILVDEAGVVVIPVDETGVVVIPVDETGVSDRSVKIPWGSDKEVQGPLRSILENVRQRLGSAFPAADAMKANIYWTAAITTQKIEPALTEAVVSALPLAFREELDAIYCLLEPQAPLALRVSHTSKIVQFLMDHGRPDQISTLLGCCKGRVMRLAKSSYGMYSLCKAFMLSDASQKALLATELSASVERILEAPTATYVFQHAILHLPRELISKVLVHTAENCTTYISNPRDTHLLQALITRGGPEITLMVVQRLGPLFYSLLEMSLNAGGVLKSLLEALAQLPVCLERQQAAGTVLEAVMAQSQQLSNVMLTDGGSGALDALLLSCVGQQGKKLIKTLRGAVNEIKQSRPKVRGLSKIDGIVRGHEELLQVQVQKEQNLHYEQYQQQQQQQQHLEQADDSICADSEIQLVNNHDVEGFQGLHILDASLGAASIEPHLMIEEEEEDAASKERFREWERAQIQRMLKERQLELQSSAIEHDNNPSGLNAQRAEDEAVEGPGGVDSSRIIHYGSEDGGCHSAVQNDRASHYEGRAMELHQSQSRDEGEAVKLEGGGYQGVSAAHSEGGLPEVTSLTMPDEGLVAQQTTLAADLDILYPLTSPQPPLMPDSGIRRDQVYISKAALMTSTAGTDVNIQASHNIFSFNNRTSPSSAESVIQQKAVQQPLMSHLPMHSTVLNPTYLNQDSPVNSQQPQPLQPVSLSSTQQHQLQQLQSQLLQSSSLQPTAQLQPTQHPLSPEMHHHLGSAMQLQQPVLMQQLLMHQQQVLGKQQTQAILQQQYPGLPHTQLLLLPYPVPVPVVLQQQQHLPPVTNALPASIEALNASTAYFGSHFTGSIPSQNVGPVASSSLITSAPTFSSASSLTSTALQQRAPQVMRPLVIQAAQVPTGSTVERLPQQVSMQATKAMTGSGTLFSNDFPLAARSSLPTRYMSPLEMMHAAALAKQV
ncbi:hypothetical protein CEUSTIGMA_g12819.t1 [Chlamydomonas eustigma]|uniref:PUM-HD domain-containing protein n=1 Tax=Chlamydomonas eustigma TaxID=1157962 RepID=A0A250XQV4_9CHLO|nr:hypothetical protein CEUSTIGMA_g12819.t1 [Chlamydomonas eustigma]|eukprot:GAX85403.1 hypothetical protein CEUSTIGMA_g12819.t1 [Chlamydomonas eustigma]